MIWLEKLTYISAIVGLCGYFLQLLMIANCCDKYIKFQVNLFRVTTISAVIAVIGYFISVVMK